MLWKFLLNIVLSEIMNHVPPVWGKNWKRILVRKLGW